MPANTAEAGILSFFKNIMGISEQNIQTKESNSQTIHLLEASLNSGKKQAKGGGDITIVNQSALLPDSGPLGTIADMESALPPQDQISIYIVREDDSLSQIAKMFGISTNTLIWANNIKKGNLIKAGQTLVILPVSGVKYSAKKGDTLKSIAKKLKGDAEEIANYNDIELSATLTLGQTVIVPNGEFATPKYNKSYSKRKVRGTNGPSYAGYYLRPIDGGQKSQGLHGYNAVDLAVSCGTPIMAAASGDVIISRNYGWNAGYGKYVVISHPNRTQTLYAHMSDVIVSNGWHAVKGQVIGYIGSTGRSTGCHTHFEIRGAKNPF